MLIEIHVLSPYTANPLNNVIASFFQEPFPLPLVSPCFVLESRLFVKYISVGVQIRRPGYPVFRDLESFQNNLSLPVAECLPVEQRLVRADPAAWRVKWHIAC